MWLNGHEWAECQLAKSGIGYAALDNGFRSCEDPRCSSGYVTGSAPAVTGFFWRWQRRLPLPFTATDLRAG